MARRLAQRLAGNGGAAITDITIATVMTASVNERKAPLTLDRINVATSAGLSGVVPGSSRPVLFGGRESVTIAPGQEITSDTVDMAVAPLTTLALSTFMKDAVVQSGNFMRGKAYVGSGDLTRSASIGGSPSALSAYFVTRIDVLRSTTLPVVVTFGDSITYGWGSTPDAYNDYPSKVSELSNATSPRSVVNSGFPGSRWVRDYFGPSGSSRFKRDVLDVPGVTDVVILPGINDIGVGFTRSRETNDATELADPAKVNRALQDAIDAAKRAGLKVHVGTLMPWKGFGHFTSGAPGDIPGGRWTPYDGEQVRQDINAFIRSNRSIDKVLDFDRMIQDPQDPLRQKPALTSDRLHPSDTGYAAMARMVFEGLVQH